MRMKLELLALMALHVAAALLALWVLFTEDGWWQFEIAFGCLVWIQYRLFTGSWLRHYRQGSRQPE